MSPISRRRFLLTSSGAVALTTGLSAAAARVNTARVVPGRVSPNERLNIAAIGVGGICRSNLRACASENIVALCDVDDVRAAETYQKFPKAKRYRDFRVLLDKEHRNIDAVIVATPDHTHAVIAMAVSSGLIQ